jgi:hypothetical protein
MNVILVIWGHERELHTQNYEIQGPRGLSGAYYTSSKSKGEN